MTKWLGTEPTERVSGARPSRILIATSRGESAESTGILRMTSRAMTCCHRLIASGMFTKKGSRPPPVSSCTTTIRACRAHGPNVVFVLGGPGAGKGTMCELAESQLGWTHLSTGDLLRAERLAGGPTAATIEAIISEGKLVPNEITVELLRNAMDRVTRTTGKNNFLIDGFPRSLSNLEGWNEIFGSELELPKMLFFECPYAVLEKRIMGRAKYTGRSDDNLESLKLRFDTFKAETLPTVEMFRGKNKCIEIDTGQDRQIVYDIVCSHLKEFTDKQLVAQPLTERAEMLLGLRPFPKDENVS